MSRPSYFALINDGEPFRLLFPIGFLFGITGTLLWPAYAWNLLDAYPGIMHSRIMIEGFMTAFIFGFLGTALPRLIEVRRFSILFSFFLSAGLIMVVLLHGSQQHLAGDICYLVTLTTFVGNFLLRFGERKDTPPPAFILVAAGLLCGISGAALQVLIQTYPEILPAIAFPLTRLLLNQGFLILPIMGVGAFLLPRFFGLASRQNFPESRPAPPGWYGEAGFASLCGLLVLGSFLLEASGFYRPGIALRMGGIVLFLIRELPFLKSGNKGGSIAMALQLALLAIPSGYLLMMIWPPFQASLQHVVFITGFSLLVLTAATRVILGHGGQSRLFHASMKSIRFMVILVVLAMLGRVSADWLPEIRFSHYGYASIFWVVGAIIWGVAILPSVRLPGDEE